jgi:hypothetical protein
MTVWIYDEAEDSAAAEQKRPSMISRFEIKTRLRPIPKASIPLRR